MCFDDLRYINSTMMTSNQQLSFAFDLMNLRNRCIRSEFRILKILIFLFRRKISKKFI